MSATKWKQTYVYGLPHERLSMTFLPANDYDNGWEPRTGVGGAEPGVPPKTLWYLTDALGSTLSLLEKDGRKSVSYHYDEFGIPLDDKKFDVNWPGPDNLFGYTGLGYEYYSELTYARARYYQPEIGRFISEDPYKGDLWNPQSQNRFVYVGNNPVLYIDPSGNMKITQINQLRLGVQDTLWETLKDTLDWRTYMGFYDLGMALLNRDIKIEDLLSAIGSSAKQKVEYFRKNTKHVFAGNPTDEEVRRYGQELGGILAMVGGSTAALKLIQKVSKDLAKKLDVKGLLKDETGTVGKKKVSANDIVFSDKFKKSAYKNQVADRGWTNKSIAKTINNPYKTGKSVNKHTGNSVTVYYKDKVHYVAVDNGTGKVIQVSDLNKSNWVFDSTFSK